MEVASFSSVENALGMCSLMEAMVVDTLLAAAGKSLALLFMATGSLLTSNSPDLTAIDERFPLDELHKKQKPGVENKDGSDTEDDEEDDDEDDDDQDDDDAGDEDFSGEEGGEEEGDPEDDPVANGNAGSDDDDDDDEEDGEDGDEDEDGEDEDEEEEDEEDDEVPQPPTKKRK